MIYAKSCTGFPLGFRIFSLTKSPFFSNIVTYGTNIEITPKEPDKVANLPGQEQGFP